MKFVEFGTGNSAQIVLLHGGGLAPWNYFAQAGLLREQYHVIIPVLDGHSGSDRGFVSIEENARSIIGFIDERFQGKVLVMGGLSLGGQILTEILSQRPDICSYAVIESALVLPMPLTAALMGPALHLSYPLVKKRWFAKLQFSSLHMDGSFFEAYFRDSAAISEESMAAFLAANARYQLKQGLKKCSAKVLVLVGGKEQRMMRQSAELICRAIPDSTMEVIGGFRHGELSINRPGLYTEKLLGLMGQRQLPAG